jgi:uncharacterized phosphosugar-binding protein
MKKSLKEYHAIIASTFDAIMEDDKNEESLDRAADLIAHSIASDRLVYLVGPGGHSNMTTEECLCRAGMLVQLNPMIDATNLVHGTTKTRFLQRSGGYAKGLLEEYGVQKEAVIIVINAYGINYLTIDMALEAKKRGLHVIGLGSHSFAKVIASNHPARHPCGKNLEDVVDVFIDCKMPFGDAVIDMEGSDQKVGPTSTLCNIFSINLLMMLAVEKLIEMGVKPKVWRSINMPNGDEFNASYFKDYGQRIRFLL